MPGPIGFFDSGVGGLSILKAAQQCLPYERMLYLADSAHFPYGALTGDAVTQRATRASAFLIAHHARLIVVACNTATVHAIAHLRATFPGTPFVGVVPVVKVLAAETRTGAIAILSTPSTAASPYLADLIATHAACCTVLNIACPGLAELIEAGDMSVDALLTPCLHPLQEGAVDVDVVGLGCTHYPFLRDQIQRHLAPGVRIFDSGLPVSRRIHSLLAQDEASTLLCASSSEVGSPSCRYFTTGDPGRFRAIAERLLHAPIGQVSHASL
jgi:glutamate racemase